MVQRSARFRLAAMLAAAVATSARAAGPGGLEYHVLAEQHVRVPNPAPQEISDAPHFRVSPDGRRVAYVERTAQGERVVVDAVPGPEFERVDMETFTFSADSKRHAYVADGAAGFVAVVDGVAGERHWQIGASGFSPTGARHFYVARSGPRAERLVIDGKAGPEFGAIDVPVFSGSAAHYAYLALHVQGPAPAEGGRPPAPGAVLVRDGEVQALPGVPSGHMGAALQLTADGAHYAYLEARPMASDRRVVVDGAPQQWHREVKALHLGEDGRRLTYIASNGLKWRVVNDGEAGTEYAEIDAATFTLSPDGKRSAMIASDDGRSFVVVDGKAGLQVNQVGALVFSADGRHLAYSSNDKTGSMLVRDGVALYRGPCCIGQPLFGRDGRFAVVAPTRDGKMQVLIDGKPAGRAFAHVRDLTVSPDGRHFAWIAAERHTAYVITPETGPLPVPGVRTGVADDDNDRPRLRFLSEDRVAAFFTRANRHGGADLLRVELGLRH